MWVVVAVLSAAALHSEALVLLTSNNSQVPRLLQTILDHMLVVVLT